MNACLWQWWLLPTADLQPSRQPGAERTVQKSQTYSVHHCVLLTRAFRDPVFRILAAEAAREATLSAVLQQQLPSMSAATFSALAEGDPEYEYVYEVRSGWYMAASQQLQSCS